jgi:hypothetical protein
MGFTVEGAAELVVLLENVSGKVRKNNARFMKAQAFKLRDLARQMSPRDYGPLENSIKADTIDGSGGRDDLSGRMTRKEWVVYVDPDDPAPERGPGVTVGDYATWAHESERAGSGLNSVIKQMHQPNVEVGPKFLERAAEEVDRKLKEELIRATFALLG